MITVLLEDKDDKEIARISEASNVSYLIKEIDDDEYPYLSELSTVSADVFASSRMEELIAELEKVKQQLIEPQQIAHINEIIRLAYKCRENEGYTLVFTPFGAFLDNPIKTHILKKPNAAEAEKSE